MIYVYNIQELIIGAIFALCFVPIIGYLAIPLAIATAWLWAKSGMPKSSKLWRRLGVPLITALTVSLLTGRLAIWLSVPVVFGILSIGYGIPDKTDDGSALGAFWLKHTDSTFWANILTRGTIYSLLAITYVLCLLF